MVGPDEFGVPLFGRLPRSVGDGAVANMVGL